MVTSYISNIENHTHVKTHITPRPWSQGKVTMGVLVSSFDAILDRLLNGAHRLQLIGDSMRRSIENTPQEKTEKVD